MENSHSTKPPAKSPPSSGAVTAAIGITVAVVALIFVFNATGYASNWYFIFKLIHVLGAVVWVGGGTVLTILAIRAERSQDSGEIATIARQAAFVGEKIFAPVGLLVFLMGIAMVINFHWGWGTTWVTIGLLGYIVTFLTGILVLSPLAKRISKLMETEGPDAPETQAAIQRIMLIARVDVGVLLLVVADMILKPFS